MASTAESGNTLRLVVMGENRIGMVYFTTSARRFMSDGHVLVNKGFGWKLYKKLERGEEVHAAYGYDAMSHTMRCY